MNVKTAAGFTIIELVLVIAIIGILAVTVVPQWDTTTGLNVNFTARQMANDFRYAQALSMSTGLRYRFVVLSSSSYEITNNAGSAIILPSGGTQMTLTQGVTIGTLTNMPNNLIAFDSRGIPYTDTGSPGTALASTAAVPVTASGMTRSVQVTPQTGYVTLQ